MLLSVLWPNAKHFPKYSVEFTLAFCILLNFLQGIFVLCKLGFCSALLTLFSYCLLFSGRVSLWFLLCNFSCFFFLYFVFFFPFFPFCFVVFGIVLGFAADHHCFWLFNFGFFIFLALISASCPPWHAQMPPAGPRAPLSLAAFTSLAAPLHCLRSTVHYWSIYWICACFKCVCVCMSVCVHECVCVYLSCSICHVLFVLTRVVIPAPFLWLGFPCCCCCCFRIAHQLIENVICSNRVLQLLRQRQQHQPQQQQQQQQQKQ